jgi:hypothetical protein
VSGTVALKSGYMVILCDLKQEINISYCSIFRQKKKQQGPSVCEQLLEAKKSYHKQNTDERK